MDASQQGGVAIPGLRKSRLAVIPFAIFSWPAAC